MHKINSSSLNNDSLFGISLNELIPKDHPKRVILDKLPWNELVRIARRAYKSDYWKDKPNVRIIVGLFVWSCLTKDETYRNIEEDFSFNILCAYACGFKSSDTFRKIHHTTLIKFEEHLGIENILEIKDIIEKQSLDNQPPNSKSRHSGDTTVIESEITYPTDTNLMETVRKFLVNNLIKEFQKEVHQDHRHYDRVARAEYLAFAKKRKTGKKEIKQIKKKQLQFLKRNLRQAKEIITTLKEKVNQKEIQLKGKDNQKAFQKLKTKLEIANKIYSQQEDLCKEKKVKDRIVSFHRPNVRPIFRGKAKKKTEFGVKICTTIVGKALVLGKMDYNNFYDGKGLTETILEIKNKGYPIKEIIGDKGNGGMCSFLKENEITDGIEKRGKRKKDPPIPKKRFVSARNRKEGSYGLLKRVFIKGGSRAKTDFGDFKKICKSFIGYNLNYAF